jgi:hypothetical protein
MANRAAIVAPVRIKDRAMTTDQAFSALERIINAAAHAQFSEAIIQNAREGLGTLRAKLKEIASDYAALEYLDHEASIGAQIVQDELKESRDDCALWQRRANLQLDVTRAAVSIVAAPFQIYDSRIGHTGYCISPREFEDLERAVETYKKLAETESASATPTD